MRNKSKRQWIGLAVLVVAAVLVWRFGPWRQTPEESPTTQPAATTQPGVATTQTTAATTTPAPTPQPAPKPAPKPAGVTAAQAADTLKASCQTRPEDALTPPARLAAVGQRLNAMLQAVKTVRMAMDDFYGSLTDQQKAAFDAIGPQQMRDLMSDRPSRGGRLIGPAGRR